MKNPMTEMPRIKGRFELSASPDNPDVTTVYMYGYVTDARYWEEDEVIATKEVREQAQPQGHRGIRLAKHLLGQNVTVYSIDGPREIVKAGKIKLDENSPEPVIVLDKVVGNSPAKTDRYIIQIAQRAIPKLVNKVIRIVLHDNEAFHKVPEEAAGMPVYEFEVNFSADDNLPDDSDGYPSNHDSPE